MSDPSILRDSTQIVLPSGVLADYRGPLEERFTVTVVTHPEVDASRIIGSPTEIKDVSDFLSRRGVQVA